MPATLEAKDPAEAVRIYRELVKRHPEFAETHYRLARLLEQTGAWDEARDHYAKARECDGMPLRCPEPLRQAYREVAAGHPSVVLVDGPRVLEAKSRHGIIDDRFFHDAQHPNLHGYVALAEDLLNQLCSRGAFSWPAGTNGPGRRCRGVCSTFRHRGHALGRHRFARHLVLERGRLYPLRSPVPP